MIKGDSFLNSSRKSYLVILSMLLLPVFFINKNLQADWGDDYIQYIYQGHHLPNTTDYKTIVNPEDHGPVKRGILFSALLAVNSKTDNLLVYKNIICMTYLVSGLFIFLFLSKHFSLLQSLLATLVVCYNYRNLWLKNEIVPEYLFMCFLYFAAFLIFSGKKYKPIIFALVFACLVSVRTVGIIFYISYLLHVLFARNVKAELEQRLIFISKSILWMILFFMAFDRILLPLNKGYDVGFYNHALFGNFKPALIADNVFFYIKNLSYFFEQEVPHVINLALIYPSLIIALFGLIIRLSKRWTFTEFAFILYFLTLLFWPDQGAAHRFLIPILPLIFYFFLNGLNFLCSKMIVSPRWKDVSVAAVLIVLLLSNAKTILLMKDHSAQIGPFSEILQPDFQYIKDHTKASDIIAFCKPYVINYKCDRNSFALTKKTKNDGMGRANYFLIAKDPRLNEAYDQGRTMPCVAKDTIELNYFTLYKLK